MKGWVFPAWLKQLLAALVIGYAAFRAVMRLGRRVERAEGRAKRAEGNLKAAQDAKEIRYETETSDDKHLVDFLSGRVRR
jgi:hypothetical protein